MNSDGWKAKCFQCHLVNFAWYESRGQRDCAKSYVSQFKFLWVILKRRAWPESDKVSIYSFNPNHLIFFFFTKKTVAIFKWETKSLFLTATDNTIHQVKICHRGKMKWGQRSGWGVIRIEFGNPQPSGPQQWCTCEYNLYPLTLVSLPCGMLCLCACVKSEFKLTDFLLLDLLFHIV